MLFPPETGTVTRGKKFGYQTFYKKEENSEGEGARNLSAQDENLTAMKNEIN